MHVVSSTSEENSTRLTIRRFFKPDGVLSQSHQAYEYRPGQFEMAKAVEAALAGREHLLVEAGTGTGKTLAYLVPSLLAGKRVVISTGTKNLQEQLFFKDVAFLQTLSPEPLRVCYMKGRANYLCRQKLYEAETEPLLHGIEEIRDYQEIRDWEKETESGDRSELKILGEDSTLWPKLDARSERCSGQKCPQFDRCFITEMHRRAAASDIIIVNHHLFFADLAVRDAFGSLLPDYGAVIFDEAHEIEDIAGQYFGISVSNLQVQYLVRDIADVSRRKLFSTSELDRALVHLNESGERFFALFAGAEGRHAFNEQETFLEANDAVFRELLFSIDAVVARLELESGVLDATLPLVRRAKSIAQALRFWMDNAGTEFVYWVERRLRGIYLQAIPIDVSLPLQSRLFDKVPTVVMTSATLTVAGTFDYTQARLGIPHVRTLQVESQYDYRKQVLLYVPRQLPEPRDKNFSERAGQEVLNLLEASRGRAFVLFTSFAQMRQIYNLVRKELDYPLFLQGDAPKNALLDRFRGSPGGVLFGTSSFWQGVDVQGEQLSCVIIDRLPFAVPSDPVIAARSESIRANGGDPFYDYQIPQAALTLKQGFGRLIRSTTDRGILALLDNRITRRPYGQVFFDSLPPYRFTDKIGDVRDFFDV